MASRSGLDSPRVKPVLVYLVTEDWYFLSHRVPMALNAQRAGYDVHVITHVDKDGAAIEALGFQIHPIEWKRGSTSLFAFLASVRAILDRHQPIDPQTRGADYRRAGWTAFDPKAPPYRPTESEIERIRARSLGL